MQFLSLVLFFPTFLILGALFMLYPRRPGGRARRLFELAVLAVALGLSVWAMLWGVGHADPNAGAIWKQVLATLLAYGVFLAVVLLAWPIRSRLLRGR